jgi:hypothetical protein
LLLQAAHGALNSPTLSIHFSSTNLLFLVVCTSHISDNCFSPQF